MEAIITSHFTWRNGCNPQLLRENRHKNVYLNCRIMSGRASTSKTNSEPHFLPLVIWAHSFCCCILCTLRWTIGDCFQGGDVGWSRVGLAYNIFGKLQKGNWWFEYECQIPLNHISPRQIVDHSWSEVRWKIKMTWRDRRRPSRCTFVTVQVKFCTNTLFFLFSPAANGIFRPIRRTRCYFGFAFFSWRKMNGYNHGD